MNYDPNWKHPELQEGEIMLINIKQNEVWNKPDFMEYIRVGNIAYRTYGKGVVEDMKPLFGKLKLIK
jgi:hypothetical protein